MANDPSTPDSSSTDELESDEASPSISTPTPTAGAGEDSSGADGAPSEEGDEPSSPAPRAEAPQAAPRSDMLARLAQARAPAYSPEADYQKQLAAFGVGSPTAKEANPTPTPLFSPTATQHIGRFLEAASGNPAALWGEVREKADAIAGGTLGAAQGILNSGIDLANFAERHLVGQGADSQALIPDEYRFNFADRLFPHSADPTDELVRGVTQYMVPMAALSKASTAIGAVRTAGPLAQFAVHEGISALTNFAAFDPGGERLSDLVQKNPSLANPVTAYLASDPNDSKAEGRFKQTLEGMGLGVLSYPLFNATKLVRYFKGLGEAGEGAVGGGVRGAAAEGSSQGVSEAGAQEAPAQALPEGHVAVPPSVQDEMRQNTQGTGELAGPQESPPTSAKPTFNPVLDSEGQPTGQTEMSLPGAAPVKLDQYDKYRGLLDEMNKWTPEEQAKNADQKERLQYLVSGMEQHPEIADRLPENAPTGDHAPGEPQGEASPAQAPEGSPSTAADAGSQVPARRVFPGAKPRPGVPLNPEEVFGSATTDTDRAFNISLDKMGADGDVKDFIQRLSEHPLIQARVAYFRRMGGDTMEGLAKMLGVDVESLMNRKVGEAWSKDQFDLGRATLQVIAEDAMQKAERALGTGASDLDRASFQTSVNRFIQLQENLTGAITETARGLRSLQDTIGMPQGEDQSKLLYQILSMNGGREGIEKTAQRVAQMAKDPNGMQAFAQAARLSWGQKIGDALMQVGVNGMLSSPKTGMRYLLSHATTVASAPIDRAMAEVYSQMRGEPMTGVAPGEALAMVRSMPQGFLDGVQVGWKSFKTGVSPDWVTPFGRRPPAISGERFGVGGSFGDAIDAIGQGISLPTRILGSMSDFFKAMHYRMELNALAVRDSFRQGLSGQAFEDNIKRILNDPPQDLHMGAVDAARINTFQGELKGAFQAPVDLVNRVPLLKVLFPFMPTPMNIVKFGAEHSPLAPAFSQLRDEFAAGGLRGDMAKAKLTTGTAFLGGMAYLGAQGHITGGGPSNPAQRKILEAAGWQPYSVKIGDKYLSYKGLGPFANIMGMAGDITETIAQTSNPMEMVAHGAAHLAQFVTPEYMLQHVSDLVDTIKSGDPEKAKTFLSQLAGTYLVPYSALMRSATRASDPTVRETRQDGSEKFALWDRFMNEVKSGIPGYSSTLPPRMNMWGETIHYHPGWGFDFVSPIATSQEDNTPIVKEMQRLHIAGEATNYELPQQQRAVGLSMPTRVPTYQGVRMPLDEKEYGRLIELSAGIGLKGAPGGLSLKDNLNQMVEKGYPQLGSYAGNDQFRSSEIKRTIQSYRNMAVQQLFQEDDHLYSKLRSRQQLMIQQQRSGSSQQ